MLTYPDWWCLYLFFQSKKMTDSVVYWLSRRDWVHHIHRGWSQALASATRSHGSHGPPRSPFRFVFRVHQRPPPRWFRNEPDLTESARPGKQLEYSQTVEYPKFWEYCFTLKRFLGQIQYLFKYNARLHLAFTTSCFRDCASCNSMHVSVYVCVCVRAGV